jgi:hypothetical protein
VLREKKAFSQLCRFLLSAPLSPCAVFKVRVAKMDRGVLEEAVFAGCGVV